jgi:O-antigen/teichoic acid export membrane protein
MVRAFWAFVVRVLGAGASYAMTVLIVRVLGAAEAGHFYLGMSLVAVLATIGNVGLEYSVLRFAGVQAGANRAAVESIVRVALGRAARVLSALAVATALVSLPLGWSGVIAPGVANVFAWVAPAIVFLGLSLIAGYALQAIQHASMSAVVFSVATPAIMIAGNLKLAVGAAPEMAVMYVVATATTLVVALALFRLVVGRHRSRTQVDATELFSTGRVFWGGIIANQLLMSNGHLIAGLFLSAHDVTIFAVAQRTVTLISFVLVAINFVVAPRYAALNAAGDRASLRRLAGFAAVLSTLASVPLIAIVCFVPTKIMNIFEHGLGGGTVLIILALGQLLTAACGTFGVLLDMTGDERFHRRVIVGTTLLAVVLLLILTPAVGVVGAALAMTIGLAAQNVIQMVRVLRSNGAR